MPCKCVYQSSGFTAWQKGKGGAELAGRGKHMALATVMIRANTRAFQQMLYCVALCSTAHVSAKADISTLPLQRSAGDT